MSTAPAATAATISSYVNGTGGCVLVEQLSLLTVEHRVVAEVAGRRRLPFGHEADERVTVGVP